MNSVIIYTYFSSHSSDYNLNFFVKKELSYKDNIDYIIVINGYEYNKNIQFPNLPNLTILKRENIGYDFGGHNYALEYIERNSKKSNVMFDIGANIGAYSLVAAKNGLSVFAFEPAYQNFYQLNRNITLNNVDSMISTFPIAFSTKTKIEKFNYIDATTGSSKCYYNEGNKYHLDEKVIIQKSTMIYALDDFIEKFGIPIPDMLKIDVDGAEFEILKGANKILEEENLKFIIIEIDDDLNSIE